MPLAFFFPSGTFDYHEGGITFKEHPLKSFLWHDVLCQVYMMTTTEKPLERRSHKKSMRGQTSQDL